ncbi:MAG: OB-fold domain-containing protein [Betaproteobacteria bacterium]|nr:OB-fold domain-containing protein [Betaproteobacteria bacterium]
MTAAGGAAPVAAGLFTNPDAEGAIRLLGQRCRACGACFFPGGRMSCIRCFGTELETVELDGAGKVECLTVVRQAPKGYYGPLPYAIGSVVLGADVRVLAQLVGRAPEAWRCGDAVAACVFELPRARDGGDPALCYGFRPSASAAERTAAERSR